MIDDAVSVPELLAASSTSAFCYSFPPPGGTNPWLAVGLVTRISAGSRFRCARFDIKRLESRRPLGVAGRGGEKPSDSQPAISSQPGESRAPESPLRRVCGGITCCGR